MHVAIDASFLKLPPSDTAVNTSALVSVLGALPDVMDLLLRPEWPIDSHREPGGLPAAAGTAGAPGKGSLDRLRLSRGEAGAQPCRRVPRHPLALRGVRADAVGGDGLLLEPQLEPLAAAMSALLDDAERRAEPRAHGLARAAAFSWEQTTRLTLAAYEEGLVR